jgi:hypothetical protein
MGTAPRVRLWRAGLKRHDSMTRSHEQYVARI